MIPISDDNPVHRTPWVNWSLIGLCLGIFATQLGLGESQSRQVIANFAFIPAAFFGGGASFPQWAFSWPSFTVVTSMFLHGGVLHLGGNMLYLWIFGNNIEDAMGHGRFLAFYLLAGTAAALTEGAINPDSAVPMVGASGAISGVLAGYLLIYPQARVTVIVPLGILLYPMKISALFVIVFWFLIQLLQAAVSDPGQPGVAWWAHIGGFAAGLILVPFFSHHPLFGRYRRGPWG